MALRKFDRGGRGAAVLFVSAEWCPHCRNARPELVRAAAILGSVVPVQEVDSERDKDVVERLGVGGFPTIMFRDASGRLSEYTGPRRGKDIADWACAHSGNCGRSNRLY
jgi:protein disulfide-isomerase A1